MKDKWIRVPEVAEIFGVTKPTVYAWIRHERIPKPVDLGGIRWERRQFHQWLKEKYGDAIYA